MHTQISVTKLIETDSVNISISKHKVQIVMVDIFIHHKLFKKHPRLIAYFTSIQHTSYNDGTYQLASETDNPQRAPAALS